MQRKKGRKMKKCKECFTANSDDAKYCRHCGKKIKDRSLGIALFCMFICSLVIVLMAIFTVPDSVHHISDLPENDTVTLDTASVDTSSVVDNPAAYEVRMVNLGKITCTYLNERNVDGGAQIFIYVDVENMSQLEYSHCYKVVVKFYDQDNQSHILDEFGKEFELIKDVYIKDAGTKKVRFYINDENVRYLMNNTYDLLATYDVLLYNECGNEDDHFYNSKLNLRQFTSGPDDG